jgi:hypothetical protein
MDIGKPKKIHRVEPIEDPAGETAGPTQGATREGAFGAGRGTRALR